MANKGSGFFREGRVWREGAIWGHRRGRRCWLRRCLSGVDVSEVVMLLVGSYGVGLLWQ